MILLRIAPDIGMLILRVRPDSDAEWRTLGPVDVHIENRQNFVARLPGGIVNEYRLMRPTEFRFDSLDGLHRAYLPSIGDGWSSRIRREWNGFKMRDGYGIKLFRSDFGYYPRSAGFHSKTL